MHVTTYDRADAFLAQVQPYLERHEAYNNLPLGIAGRLLSPDPARPAPLLATVADDALALVALMTPPHNLILSSDRPDPQAALAALAQRLKADQWSLPGVLGPNDLPLDFARIWGRRARVELRLRVYELTAVEYSGSAPGALRPIRADDSALAIEWKDRFDRDVGDTNRVPDDPDAYREGLRTHVQHHLDQQTLYFWEVDGRPVSMAARTRPTAHGEVINDVYTPPEFRGRGYATACVAALSQWQLDAGKSFSALFTDLANPTSNSIYQKIGYKPLGDFIQAHFVD